MQHRFVKMRHEAHNWRAARVSSYTIRGGITRWRVHWRSRAKSGREDSLAFATESEAKQRKALLEQNDNDSNRVARIMKASHKHGPTVEDMIHRFIDEGSQGSHETRLKYRSNSRIYIFDEIGWIPAKYLTPRDVRKLIRSITDKGKSPKTVKNVVGVLSAAMRLAVDDAHTPSHTHDHHHPR